MMIQKLFKQIESHDFAAELNLALNLRNFFKIAERQECVRQLRQMLKDAKNITTTVIRIAKLAKQKVDARYENPYDTAIAIYTWALFLENRTAGKIAAEYATEIKQGWWTPKYAQQILKEIAYYTPTEIKELRETDFITYRDVDIREVFFCFGIEPRHLPGVDWDKVGSRSLTSIAGMDPWTQKSLIHIAGRAINEPPYACEAKEAKLVIIDTDFMYKPPHEESPAYDFLTIGCE